MAARVRWNVAAMGAVLLAHAAAAQVPLTPDFAFHFVCKQNDHRAMENSVEIFLKHEGFRVLNQARIQREYGLVAFDIMIFGLDEKKMIFKVNALPRTKGRYAVSLITKPPTQRSTDSYCAVIPPSITSSEPVTQDDSSEARNNTPLAMSSAVPSRPIGVRSIRAWRTAGSLKRSSVNGVSA